MQAEELLRIVGGHYMALLLQKEMLARENQLLRAQLKALEPTQEEPEGETPEE